MGMTDEELIAHLRDTTVFAVSKKEVADHLEQLKAKLTKAMNALREIKSVECAHCTDLFNELADAVLDGTEGET